MVTVSSLVQKFCIFRTIYEIMFYFLTQFSSIGLFDRKSVTKHYPITKQKNDYNKKVFIINTLARCNIITVDSAFHNILFHVFKNTGERFVLSN